MASAKRKRERALSHSCSRGQSTACARNEIVSGKYTGTHSQRQWGQWSAATGGGACWQLVVCGSRTAWSRTKKTVRRPPRIQFQQLLS